MSIQSILRALRVTLPAALLLTAAGLGAAPAVSELDAQAREALRSGQYRQAIALTREITRVEPLSTLNWYRLAIAAERERDYALAARALHTAERLDPSLSFASSPERVQSLRAAITAGGGSYAAPEPAKAIGADEAPLSPAPAASSVPGAVEPVPVALAAQAPSAVPAVAPVGEPAWHGTFVAYSLVVLASLVALVAALRRAARQLIRARKVDVATMPLDDLLVHCRDQLALLQQRLDYHGHQDTEIATVLGRLQPAFARECGRSRLSLENFKDDRPLADVKEPLPARIPVLGSSSAEQVHKDAVMQALQHRRA